jgi:hypothetical protein
MALWFKEREYDDELAVRVPHADPVPIVLGDTVKYHGNFWAFLGYDEPMKLVYIGLDNDLRIVRAEDVGLVWERPTYGGEDAPD